VYFILCTWSIIVYPETHLKEHISAISMFLLSDQFRAQFPLPCISKELLLPYKIYSVYAFWFYILAFFVLFHTYVEVQTASVQDLCHSCRYITAQVLNLFDCIHVYYYPRHFMVVDPLNILNVGNCCIWYFCFALQQFELSKESTR
jgi:hypothetical protein